MNILTFDVEDWFHLLDHPSTANMQSWYKFQSRIHANIDKILELLDKKDQKATFFCLGWMARRYPDIIRMIDSSGHELGSHSDLHELVYLQSREQFCNSLERSIKSIEDLTGKKVISYRAPGFSITNTCTWAFEELVEQGIEIDCSVFPSKRAHGGLKDYGNSKESRISVNSHVIKEFPINIYKLGALDMIFSGGGYFRLLPYPVIKLLMRQSSYVMSYFHPRDFDPKQPMIKDLSSLRKFKSYYGLSNAFAKLERLITDFEFIDIKQADRQIDWDETNIVSFP